MNDNNRFSCNLTNPPEAPKIIHFIWIGRPLPEQYAGSHNLWSFISCARKSGFTVNFWTDNPVYITHAIDRYFHSVSDALQRLISIRNISELKDEMKNNDVFTKEIVTILNNQEKPEKGKLSLFNAFWLYVDRERIGLKNLAAASDFLRYSISYLDGGYYFDTDTEFESTFEIEKYTNHLEPLPHMITFEITKNDEDFKLTPDKLPRGIRLFVTLSYKKTITHEDVCASISNVSVAQSDSTAIISCPGNQVLLDILKVATNIYTQLDKQSLTPKKSEEKSDTDGHDHSRRFLYRLYHGLDNFLISIQKWYNDLIKLLRKLSHIQNKAICDEKFIYNLMDTKRAFFRSINTANNESELNSSIEQSLCRILHDVGINLQCSQDQVYRKLITLFASGPGIFIPVLDNLIREKSCWSEEEVKSLVFPKPTKKLSSKLSSSTFFVANTEVTTHYHNTWMKRPNVKSFDDSELTSRLTSFSP